MGCFSPSESKSQSTSESKTPEQKTGLKQLLDTYLPRAGAGANIFPSDTVSPFSTLQKGAVSGAENFLPTFGAPQTASNPLMAQTQTALQGGLQGTTGAKDLDPGAFFQRSIEDPAMRRLKRDVLPGVDVDFAGPGFFGAARSQERSDVRRETAESLNQRQAQFDFDIALNNQGLAESRAGRMQAAVGQGMEFSQLPAKQLQDNLQIASQQLGGLGEIFGFGQAEQTQAQTELQAEIMKFAQENQLTDPEDLAIIMGLLGLNFSSSQSTGGSSGAGLGYAGVSSFLGGIGRGMATPKVPKEITDNG